MADHINYQEAVVIAARDLTNKRNVYLRVDEITGCLKIMQYPHSEIHDGNHYTLVQSTAADAFDIASPLTFWVTTPNTTKWAHMYFKIDCTTQVLLEIFEDDGNASHFDVSSGSAATPVQHNRNSANTSGLTIKTGVTVTQATSDCLIYSRYIGGAGPFVAGGELAEREEFILKQNTEYLFRLTTIADNNEGSFELSWYEHTNLS